MAQIAAWRNGTAQGAPVLSQPPDMSDVRTLDDGIGRVDALRLARDLEGSRWVCMALVAKHPTDARLLWRAARAESDMVLVLKARDHEREHRDVAAASGLEFARRARKERAKPEADLLAQLAWSLGTTVHLQPMFDRDDRAADTKRVADEALALDPEHPVALATLSILELRLATLPWIASLFAGDAPAGSIEGAIAHARRAVASDPSLFHHLLLARALAEAEQRDEALATLEAGLASPGYRPRDAEVREEVRVLRDALREE
jgi:tetratricopeptide (TPR) repeat protein